MKKQRHNFADKSLSSQSYGFSSSHVQMRELGHKEGWAPKNWCFWTVGLEKTFENSLDCKEIKPFNPNRNQSWIFIGRTDGEAETPILWAPDAKNWLIGKDPDAARLKAGEGANRGWDCWMASPTWWAWVWASSSNWWWTEKPGVLQSMGSQRVPNNWMTKTNWTYSQLILTKEERIYNRERTVFLANGIGKVGQRDKNQWSQTTPSHHVQK